MGRRIVLATGRAEFERLFPAVRRSWFRLETLQAYNAPYEREEFAAFQRGELLDTSPGPWHAMIRDHVAAGRKLARVHVVEEPLSDYIRYELAGYPQQVEAGEDVRIIPVRRGQWPSGVPRHDFWLFDGRDLWLMDYDDKGELIAVDLVEDEGELDRHRRWRDAAMGQSIPLAEYRPPSTRSSPTSGWGAR